MHEDWYSIPIHINLYMYMYIGRFDLSNMSGQYQILVSESNSMVHNVDVFMQVYI